MTQKGGEQPEEQLLAKSDMEEQPLLKKEEDTKGIIVEA